MNIMPGIKIVAAFAIGNSIGTFFKNIATATTPETATKFARIGARIGAMFVGYVIAEQSTNWFIKQIDNIRATVNEVKDNHKK